MLGRNSADAFRTASHTIRGETSMISGQCICLIYFMFAERGSEANYEAWSPVGVGFSTCFRVTHIAEISASILPTERNRRS